MTVKYKGNIKWSDEDECYIGTCPELFSGGCHGDTKVEVQTQLDAIIADVVEEYKKENKDLPVPARRRARMTSAVAARKSTGLNQQQFAEVIGVGIGTLRNWEQNRVQPKGTAKTLLGVISKHPEIIHEIRGVRNSPSSKTR